MIHLPSNPGLARRLAYGNYIRSRSFNTRQNSYIRELLVEELNEQIANTYEQIDPIGLCLNKLIQNTTIEIITTPLFCPICQHVKDNICVSRKLCCGHTFHIECIEYWLKDNTNCPICRYDFNNN